MRTLFILNAAIAAAVIGSVRADDIQPPFTKEGLWQASTSHTMAGKTTQMTMKVCQNRETQQKDRDLSLQLRQKDQCTHTTTLASPGVYVTEKKCTAGPNAGSATKATMTFQGDTAYRVDMHMTSSAGAESAMTIDAKYLGPCPPDMKPGDAILPNGSKLNTSGN
jgi:Protein of unknown function (DUF3617)